MAEAIETHEEQLDGHPVVWRSAPGADVLYLHGVPTSGADFVPFLTQIGGVAPDLPGFGRSGKRGDVDFTMDGLGDFVGRFVDHLGMEQVTLVVHDWGAAGLLWAMREPERVARLVVVNAVPLLPGYRWHPLARLWRTRLLGELAMGSTGHRVVRRVLRRDGVAPPEQLVHDIVEHFDQGTQRAILRLYRSAPPAALAAAGERLRAITCPALVVWGDRDPYIAPAFADAYAQALGGPTEVAHFADAGHWPWLDDDGVVGSIARFVR